MDGAGETGVTAAVAAGTRSGTRTGPNGDPPEATARVGFPVMGDGLDVDAMIQRFRERAEAVRKRPLPPVAGEERQRFIEQAEVDYQDFAIVGDATARVEDGVLVLEIDLRPPEERGGGA